MGTVTLMELARKKRACKNILLVWHTQATDRRRDEPFELAVLELEIDIQKCSKHRIGPSLSYLTIEQGTETRVCGLVVRRALEHLALATTPVRTLGDLVRTAFGEDLARAGSYAKERGLRTRLTELDEWRTLFDADAREIPADTRIALVTRTKSEVRM